MIIVHTAAEERARNKLLPKPCLAAAGIIKITSITFNLLFRCVGSLVRQSWTLSDFHNVGVSGPLKSIRRPRDVIYILTNSFQTSIVLLLTHLLSFAILFFLSRLYLIISSFFPLLISHSKSAMADEKVYSCHEVCSHLDEKCHQALIFYYNRTRLAWNSCQEAG